MPKISITLPPITILNATPAPVPVSLVSGRNTLGVEYSDGSIKTVAYERDGDIIAISQEEGYALNGSSFGCSDEVYFAGTAVTGSDYVIATLSWLSCSVNTNSITARLGITIDGVTFGSEVLDWDEDGGGEYTAVLDTGEFSIVS